MFDGFQHVVDRKSVKKQYFCKDVLCTICLDPLLQNVSTIQKAKHQD